MPRLSDNFVCRCPRCNGDPIGMADFVDPANSLAAVYEEPLVELRDVPATSAPSECYSCGSPEVVIIRDDYAICRPCEDRYQTRLATEFPFGQCQTCGAAGIDAKLTGFTPGPHHAEGACGLWADVGEHDEEDVGAIFDDHDLLGADRSLDSDDDLDELPF